MSIPYIPEKSGKRFKVPRTLAADFDNFLNQDIPNTVMNFEWVRRWYDRSNDNYKPTYIRGEIYPDSTKSRYENTDNNMNIRCSLKSGIRKGDMVVEPDGTIYILDWAVHNQSNNSPSRALRCNMMLEVYTYQDDAVTDNEGYVINSDGYVVNSSPFSEDEDQTDDRKIITAPIPANAYRYDGRPEYVAVSGTPGTIAGVLTLMTVQFNDQTKKIKIGQFFDWDEETYEIVDVNKVGVDITGTYGTLKLQAKRAAGGLHGYDE